MVPHLERLSGASVGLALLKLCAQVRYLRLPPLPMHQKTAHQQVRFINGRGWQGQDCTFMLCSCSESPADSPRRSSTSFVSSVKR